MALPSLPLLLGIDFSSRPSRRKPILVAEGSRDGTLVRLEGLCRHETLPAFAVALSDPQRPSWIGGFDLPFGLPRELVMALGWPQQWLPLMRHYASLERTQIRTTFAVFCDSRPAGGKFAHRACDRPAGSSPSMKWVNPPVAWMMHAGVPLLIDAGVTLPGLHAGDPQRIALEAYPGLLARELIGRRPYKSDEPAKQTPERALAREQLIAALEEGRSRLGLRLVLDGAQREALLADPMGDALDAVLCLLQAGWAAGQPGYGLPVAIDPLEGWIVSADPLAAQAESAA
ncbi:DUF429 domain-containing protein [Piscinibacter sakaiensis]|uniref:DUF429 domain-containing protein n=1 Tax=Piscinibacter sakaiensis TaxID=1547922 RepID=UPI003AABECD3